MRARKIDLNQRAIVKALREIAHVTVMVDVSDILVGVNGKNYLFEIKRPELISKRTGKVQPSRLTASEHHMLDTWKGQYNVVSTLEEILDIIGICGRVK